MVSAMRQRSRLAASATRLLLQQCPVSSSSSSCHAQKSSISAGLEASPKLSSIERTPSFFQQSLKVRVECSTAGGAKLGEFCRQDWRSYGVRIKELWEQDRRGYSVSSTSDSESTRQRIVSELRLFHVMHRRQYPESYLEISRVLEQGYKNLLSQGPSATFAAGEVLLMLGTLHYESARFVEALEVLQQVLQLEGIPLQMIFAADQALVGVLLRLHKDAAAMHQAISMVDLANQAVGLSLECTQELKFRAAATVQFVEHFCGANASGVLLDTSGLSPLLSSGEVHEDGVAAALLGIAECAHVRGYLEMANGYYKQVYDLTTRLIAKMKFGLRAGAMSVEEVQLGALVGLGQVALELSEFGSAEATFTKAYDLAEGINGDHHPRLGLVIACLADLYARRELVEGSGNFVFAETLYQRALHLLSAPPVDSPIPEHHSDGIHAVPEHYIDAIDVMAILRGRYAALLARSDKRVSEAEKLQAWASAAWKGSRSLTDILAQEQMSQPGPCTVNNKAPGAVSSGMRAIIDVRLWRVLYPCTSH